MTHPKLGASWEEFAMEEIVRSHQPEQMFFYGVHSGSELDLLMLTKGRRIGVEFKRADAPRLSRSMKIAMEDLQLDELRVIYPGTRCYTLAHGVEVMPLAEGLGAD